MSDVLLSSSTLAIGEQAKTVLPVHLVAKINPRYFFFSRQNFMKICILGKKELLKKYMKLKTKSSCCTYYLTFLKLAGSWQKKKILVWMT